MFFLFTARLARKTKVTRTMRRTRTGDVSPGDYGRYITIYGVDSTLSAFHSQRLGYKNAYALTVSAFFGKHYPYVRSTGSKFLRLL